MSRWPDNRADSERMEIYRVVITADVSESMGRERIFEDVADMFDRPNSPRNWDVFDVAVEPRTEAQR